MVSHLSYYKYSVILADIVQHTCFLLNLMISNDRFKTKVKKSECMCKVLALGTQRDKKIKQNKNPKQQQQKNTQPNL